MAVDALTAGGVGAVALTLTHEMTRRAARDAPRMDVLGGRAVAAALDAAGIPPPPQPQVRAAALAGDLVANTAYYSLVGVGGADRAVASGATLGVLAGLGAVFLPGPLGLGTAPSRRTPQTALMTIGLYALGGLVAGLVFKGLRGVDG